MRRLLGSGFVLSVLATAMPAGAMTRDEGRTSLGTRASISDPDEKLERLANASSAGDHGHGKPKRNSRSVLRDDPYLKAAFGWIDNK